jgi:parallel beta-helix repeat protein
MRTRRIITSTIAGLLVAGSIAAAGSALTNARRAVVTCGQTLTASVKLTSDLVGCPGTGLVVGAGGITVDLNGHTISGTNAAKSEGVAVDGHANVRVANGTVRGFRLNGIALRHASRSSVGNLTIREIGAGTKEGEAAAGILVDHSPGSTVVESVVTNHVHAYQSDGVDVLFSSGVRIQQNRLAQNAWNGLVVVKSPRSSVVGNRLDDNGNNGMEANGASDFVLVSNNHAGGNRNWGLVVGALRQARVLRNTVATNGKDGLLMFDLASSVIQGNQATTNANGIVLDGGQHGSKLNRLLGNVAMKNRGEGIVLSGAVRRNTLARNAANANSGRGIDAAAGSIDGGGNRARGNRHAPQCIGVVCA